MQCRGVRGQRTLFSFFLLCVVSCVGWCECVFVFVFRLVSVVGGLLACVVVGGKQVATLSVLAWVPQIQTRANAGPSVNTNDKHKVRTLVSGRDDGRRRRTKRHTALQNLLQLLALLLPVAPKTTQPSASPSITPIVALNA